jgi:UDP-N-acetylmuramoyl-tripeptide--D-alanyl-D-alanine ligase
VNLTTDSLARVLGTKAACSSVFQGFSIDSRTAKPQEIFIALNGKNFFGSKFIDQAINRGAVAAITDSLDGVKNIDKCLLVADINLALLKLAGYFRQQFRGYILSLTGSCGKTTTRHMVSSILRDSGFGVLESFKNYNNHFGVPYMLLHLNQQIEFAVLECGASAGGEIKPLVEMIQPDVAAVTNVHPVHMTGFGDILSIAHTKAAIYSHVKDTGLAVLPINCEYLNLLESYVQTSNKIFVGLGNKADVSAENIVYYNDSTKFLLHTPNYSCDIVLPLPGKAMLENCLTAVAMLSKLDFDKYIIQNAIAKFTPFNNRFEFKAGFRAGLTIMADCYNASPVALNAAVDVLLMQEGEKVVVLGDMVELGSDVQAKDIHKKVGKELKARGVDSLWAVGDFAVFTVKEFGMGARWFASKDELEKELVQFLSTGNLVNVLVKASRSMQFEHIVSALVGR